MFCFCLWRGAAELAGLIDHAIGRGRWWCLTATLSGQAGKQAKKKKDFCAVFPSTSSNVTSVALAYDPSLLLSLHPFFTSIVQYHWHSAPSHSHSTAQLSTAQHRNPSAAPLSQQSSICLRSLTPPSKVREYLAFLFPQLKHDGTRCAPSPSCWLCRASQILPKTVSTPFQLACAEPGFKVLSEIVFHHGN
jgi:hypothetical protein